MRCRLHKLAVEFEADHLGTPATGVRLIEVGAHRGDDQVEDLAQDAILIEAWHIGQGALDALADRLRRRLALSLGEGPTRIETQVEELDEIARQAGVPVQGIGKIAQPEGRLELAQVGAIGAYGGDLAPVRARRQDQAVEAVVVGVAAEDGEKAALEPTVVTRQFDRLAVRPF